MSVRSAKNRIRRPPVVGVLWAMTSVIGCTGTPKPLRPLDPIPMHAAATIVDDNIARIDGTVRASGTVDGYFTKPDGGRMRYSLDGVLFYLAPTYVRFDLKKFGERQILFGSNEELYWFYSKEEGGFRCWDQDDADVAPEEIPIRPDQIVDALGLTPIGGGTDVNRRVERRVQRVEADVQQVLFLEYGPTGDPVITREYWLDRFEPRLVRRVVFRDASGVVTLESFLDDYRAIDDAGPMLPHRMAADWPLNGARMQFHVGRWTVEREVVPGGPQFASPPDCR